ncbi:MAG TPA: alpha/beta hydrolase [Acidimicrobiales bacterium]|jgi:pimeloyl-ACP methyl ester carboxylesterase|nr:alpha/beta hydrolase [Acidimicrobiales bacterium]
MTTAQQPAAIVLIHGAGDTSHVWTRTQGYLHHPSIAVDLLGRASRPFDITQVTLEAAADAAADDVRRAAHGPFVVVAHSAGGMVAPAVVRRLGRDTAHLVLIAGVVAPHGVAAVDVLHPARRDAFAQHRATLLPEHAGHMYARGPAADAGRVDGLTVLSDPLVARAIDSLNLMFQPVSWEGVPAALPRTWVRPLGDALQTVDMQDRLIAACAATEVVPLDADHTPARSNPQMLARVLDEIATRYDDVSASRGRDERDR